MIGSAGYAETEPMRSAPGRRPLDGDHLRFVQQVLIVLGVIGGAVVAWRLRAVELLVFGAVLVAVMLSAFAELLRERASVPRRLALPLAVIVFALALAGACVFFAVRLQAQVAEILVGLPKAWANLKGVLATLPFGPFLTQAADRITAQPQLRDVSNLRLYLQAFADGILNTFLVLVAGVYLAAQPGPYRSGFMMLWSKTSEARILALLSAWSYFLRRWLVAQLAAMASIGTVVGVGLWALGIPAWGALGLLAALAEFIPIFGPIIAAVPALLIAFTKGWTSLLAVLALFLAINQVEANLLQPLLQRGLTTVPPVINIFAVVVFASFFGVLGVIFATPITLVLFVAVRVLYLHQDVIPKPAVSTKP